MKQIDWNRYQTLPNEICKFCQKKATLVQVVRNQELYHCGRCSKTFTRLKVRN